MRTHRSEGSDLLLLLSQVGDLVRNVVVTLRRVQDFQTQVCKRELCQLCDAQMVFGMWSWWFVWLHATVHMNESFHVWMSFVTHLNESRHTILSRVTHMNESGVEHDSTRLLIWISHVTDIYGSCHAQRAPPSHHDSSLDVTHLTCVTSKDESCHLYAWVTSHIWMSHSRTHTRAHFYIRTLTHAYTPTHTHTHKHIFFWRVCTWLLNAGGRNKHNRHPGPCGTSNRKSGRNSCGRKSATFSGERSRDAQICCCISKWSGCAGVYIHTHPHTHP